MARTAPPYPFWHATNVYKFYCCSCSQLRTLPQQEQAEQISRCFILSAEWQQRSAAVSPAPCWVDSVDIVYCHYREQHLMFPTTATRWALCDAWNIVWRKLAVMNCLVVRAGNWRPRVNGKYKLLNWIIFHPPTTEPGPEEDVQWDSSDAGDGVTTLRAAQMISNFRKLLKINSVDIAECGSQFFDEDYLDAGCNYFHHCYVALPG